MAPATIKLTFDEEPMRQGLDAAELSLRSICEALDAAHRPGDPLVEIVGEGIDASLDGRPLFRVELKTDFAHGAVRVVACVHPGEAVDRLVSILADKFDGRLSVSSRHGWPILSIGDRTPIVTGSGEGRKALPAEGAR